MSLPALAILGNGRAGKDTCGMWLHLHTPLRYAGPCSAVVCPLIAADLGFSPDVAWSSRHNNRKFWWNWANNYRKDDPAKLAKYLLERGDLVVGLRDAEELKSCKEQDILKAYLWIERDVSKDPTVTFSRQDCDLCIDNTRTFEDFFEKLAVFSQLIGLPVKHCADCTDPITCKIARHELTSWPEISEFLSRPKQ